MPNLVKNSAKERCMDLGLRGKVAIIAASSNGLGRAVAETMAREGVLVTINGRHEGTVRETARAILDAGGDAIEVIGDPTTPEGVQRLVDETVRRRGGLDIVICNAGGPPSGDFFAFPDEQAWFDAINLNLMSTIRLSRASIPHLEQRGGGSITNMVSISVKQPIPHLVLSNTARTAVIGMAKSLAESVAGRNIRVK